MKYFCKLVFADKVEPTVDFDDASVEAVRARVRALIERFVEDPSLEGIYLGKRQEEPPPS